MAFKSAPKAWLNGVTVGTADIDAAAVTTAKIADDAVTAAKLATPNSLLVLLQDTVATPAAGSTLASVQVPQAVEITKVVYSCKANGTGTSSTVIDVIAGVNAASAVSIFATAKLKCKSVSTLFSATPSGTKGIIAANGHIRYTVNAVASGTKSNGTLTVWGKTLMLA